jgi:hypothetical protein
VSANPPASAPAPLIEILTVIAFEVLEEPPPLNVLGDAIAIMPGSTGAIEWVNLDFWINKVMKYFVLAIAFVASIALVSCGKSNTQPTIAQAAAGLPPHTIDVTTLPNGKRIEVTTTNPNLTAAECTKIIEAYKSYALPVGQVNVQKPNPKPPYNGELLPYCVDNLDGKGIVFNDFFFK